VEEGGARLAQVYPREPGEASFRRTRHLDEVGTLRSVPQLLLGYWSTAGAGSWAVKPVARLPLVRPAPEAPSRSR